jgi:hypothetical protein
LSISRRAVLPLVVVAVVAGYWLYRGFFAPTPAQRIERLLERAAAAAEAKSVIRLSDYFTAGYTDASGADRAALMGYAKQFFDEVDQLTVRIARVIHEDPALGKDAEDARAIVIVQVTGTTRDNSDRFRGIGRAGGDAFEVGFRRRDGDWKVNSSRRLQGATPEELMREIKAE